MPSKTFKKEYLQELVFEGESTAGLTILSDEQVSSSRWSSHHEMVFREEATGKLYEAGYSQGLTESQDESPFEYEDDDVECIEVEAYKVSVTKYRAVK